VNTLTSYTPNVHFSEEVRLWSVLRFKLFSEFRCSRATGLDTTAEQ